MEGRLPNVDWIGTISLKKAYEFNPAYDLSASDEKSFILGVEGTLWGESIKDISRAFYMTYPRALALAEVGWTEMQNRNWDQFIKKLDMHLNALVKYMRRADAERCLNDQLASFPDKLN